MVNIYNHQFDCYLSLWIVFKNCIIFIINKSLKQMENIKYNKIIFSRLSCTDIYRYCKGRNATVPVWYCNVESDFYSCIPWWMTCLLEKHLLASKNTLILQLSYLNLRLDEFQKELCDILAHRPELQCTKYQFCYHKAIS